MLMYSLGSPAVDARLRSELSEINVAFDETCNAKTSTAKMLAVSILGKKFSCDAQFEVAEEIEGDRLKLNLKVRETCKEFLKPPGPVLATLHVSVSNGRQNGFTKCKELLTFLKEQVLPKTVKLISLKTIKKVKDVEKRDKVNLLSCMRHGKSKKRKDDAKKSCTRGYSSDTESLTQRSLSLQGISDTDDKHQTSNAGILATPMLVRTKLSGRTNLKTKEDAVKGTQKKSGSVNVEDESKAWSHSMTIFDNVDTASSRDQRNAKQEKVWYKKETGPQYVRNKQPNSSTENPLSDRKNTLSAKQAGFNFGQQGDLRLQETTVVLPTQEVAQNSSRDDLALSGVQKHKMDIFAAEYVGKICETALSKRAEEKSQEVAKDFVTNVVSLAKNRIVECENSQFFEEKDNTGKNDGYEECPSFSKVWKFSQVFAADHAYEIPESLRTENSRLKGSEFDTYSKLLGKGDEQVRNGCQYGELEPNEVIESPTSSNCSLTVNSSNSSSQSLELHKSRAKNDSLTAYELDNVLDSHSALKEAANDSQPLQGVNSDEQVIANDRFDTNTKFDESTSSVEHGGVTSGNCYTCAKEVPVEGNEDCEKTELEKGIDIDNAVSVSDLDERKHVNESDGENNTCCQNDESGFCNELNSEENETTKTEEKHVLSSIFTGDVSNNAGTKETSNLSAKKQEYGDRNKPNFRRRPLYERTVSDSQASERKQWCPTEPGGEDLQATFHRFHSSCRPDNTAPKFVRSTSCPVVSEDDILIESMLSHHEDVYDSLAKRTWIILHVHELWNGGKPTDAIKTCIELTGMADVEKDLGTTCRFNSPYALMSRDYALFLNILQQLPSSCSMWTLDLCVLLLPKLKGFIANQHHTSHVDMACSVILVVLKKVGVVVRRTSKGSKNKEKEQKVKFCTNELKEIKDMASDVIQAVKSCKKSNTEDPGSMKLVLKELQLALGTFLSNTTPTS